MVWVKSIQISIGNKFYNMIADTTDVCRINLGGNTCEKDGISLF